MLFMLFVLACDRNGFSVGHIPTGVRLEAWADEKPVEEALVYANDMEVGNIAWEFIELDPGEVQLTVATTRSEEGYALISDPVLGSWVAVRDHLAIAENEVLDLSYELDRYLADKRWSCLSEDGTTFEVVELEYTSPTTFMFPIFSFELTMSGSTARSPQNETEGVFENGKRAIFTWFQDNAWHERECRAGDPWGTWLQE